VPHPQNFLGRRILCEIIHFCALSHRNIKIGKLSQANASLVSLSNSPQRDLILGRNASQLPNY